MGKIKCNTDCRKAHHFHYGAGSPTFRGELLQEGYGLGGFLSGLVRRAIPIFSPILKEGAKALGKVALKTGRNVLTDVLTDKASFKDSVKQRLAETLLTDNESDERKTDEGRIFNEPKHRPSPRRRKGIPIHHFAHKKRKTDIFERST